MQRIPGEVEWGLDVAHNPDAARVLAQALAAAPARGRTWCVLGMLDDKDARAVADALSDAVDGWFIASLDPPRGLAAAALEARIAGALRGPAIRTASVAEACAAASAAASPGDRVVVCGSFHTVGPAMEWLGLYCAPQTR
jgi:dihydrofolate synthase/folylpolyglutamate synthase